VLFHFRNLTSRAHLLITMVADSTANKDTWQSYLRKTLQLYQPQNHQLDYKILHKINHTKISLLKKVSL